MKKAIALLLTMAMLLAVGIIPAVAGDDVTVRTYLTAPSTNAAGWIETNRTDKSFATVFSTARPMKAFVLSNYWAKKVDIKVNWKLYSFAGDFLSTVNDDSRILYQSSFVANGDHSGTLTLDFGTTYPAGEYMVTFTSEKVSEDGHFVLPVMKYGVYETTFPASHFEDYKYAPAGPVQSFTMTEHLCYAIVFDGNDSSSNEFFKPLKGREGLVKLDDIVGVLGAGDATSSPAQFTDTGILTPVIPYGKTLYSITFPGAPTWSDNSGNIGIQYDVYEWNVDYDTTVSGEPIFSNTIKNRLDGKDLELFLGNVCMAGGQYLIRLRGFHYDPDTGLSTEGQIVGAWYNTAGGTAFNDLGYMVYHNGTAQPTWSPRFSYRYASLNTESVVKYKASDLTWVANCGTFTAEGDGMKAVNDGQFAMWCEATMPDKVVASEYKYFAMKIKINEPGNIGFYTKFNEVGNYCFAGDKYDIAPGEYVLYTTFNGADAFRYENYYRTVVFPIFGNTSHGDSVTFEEIAFLEGDADLNYYLGGIITTAGIALGEDITFNVSANVLDPDVTTVEMNFVSGEDDIIVEGTLGEDGLYHFPYAGLTPQRMNDNIVMKLVLDGRTVFTKTSSVEHYAQSYYELYGADDPAVPLLAHLLQYGTAAQNYKNYNVANPAANKGWQIADYMNVSKPLDFVKERNGSTDPANTINAASMQLDNGFKLKFKYKAPSGTSFVLLDHNNNPVDCEIVESGGYSFATTEGSVLPFSFRDVYTGQLVSGDETVCTVSYTMTAYINAKWDDASCGELVRALYGYLAAAEEYIEATEVR